MTDKQIIIDGINVSELTGEQLVCMDRYEIARLFAKLVDVLSKTKDDYDDAQDDRVKMWTDNTDLTEQLKRKEQSEAKLVKQIQTICDFINNRPETFKGVNGSVDKIIIDYAARKEQECEELKKEIKHYKQIAQYHGNLSVKYTNKSAKLEQTLTEIKDIARRNHKTEEELFKIRHSRLTKFTMGHLGGKHDLAKEILQKISKCEVEDE